MHPYQLHKHRKEKHSSSPRLHYLISAGLVLSLLFFAYWAFTVVLPVATVEIGYQTKRTMVSLFHVSDLRALLVPNIQLVSAEHSKNPQGGIVIPSLFMDEPVIYNVDPNDVSEYTAALKKGIAHASSTHLPDTGGLGYYFAHSSTASLARQYNAVFYLLGKLKKGDEVILWHDGKHYLYSVTGTEITTPGDVSFLNASEGSERVVLQTCWPPGTSEKRLLVFAERK